MALKDRPRSIRKPATVHGAPCSVGQVYRTNLQDADELAEIHALLYFEGNDAAQVLTELAAAGYEVARTAINRHRGTNCRCFTIDRDFCHTCKRHLDAHDDCEQAA